jgi:uncharacterized membrane protein YoaK (UPF0700 family)
MTIIRTSVRFGMILTGVGGFLDAYSYLNRGGVFAGAQTGNVVLLGIAIANRDIGSALRLLAPILAFTLGAVCSALLHQAFLRPLLRDPFRAALIVEMLLLVIAGGLPETVPDIPASALISFAAGMQVATFRQLRNWSFTTTITTNNLVTAVTSLTHAIATKDPQERSRGMAYSCIVTAFLGGAVTGGILTNRFAEYAVLVAAGMLAVAFAWLMFDNDRTVRTSGKVN